jgi:osmotically-inducible protein OsmY
MKKTIQYWAIQSNRIIAVLCITGASMGAALLTSGCAGDRYHESTGEGIDDTAITGRVKSALHGDSQYKYGDVHVVTFKGTVQLSGFVESKDARSHAVDLAKNVQGVKDVTDNIEAK